MTKIIEHPSTFIDGKWTDPIARFAMEAEKAADLHPDQLAIIHSRRWLKMFVPKRYGGLELSLPEGVQMEECLGWADGSTAWVTTLCGGAAWFVGFLPVEVAKEIFKNDLACFAGSGAPTGIAHVIENGYEVTGHWKYASGALHATVFTANCMMMKEGAPLLKDDGTPVIQSFLFKKGQVTLIKSWHGMGMIATGSHEFSVDKLRLPFNRRFIIDSKHAVLKQPLYQYPFLQLAETTLTANLSGMAVRFMDLCEPLFEDRIKYKQYYKGEAAFLRQKLSEARNSMNECRQIFYDHLEASWDLLQSNKNIPDLILNQVSDSSRALAKASRWVVADLYQYCGLIAANSETEINRVWRNFHTACQHDLFMRQNLLNP